MGLGQVVERRDRVPRNNQHMDRSLRCDIPKRHAVIILIEDICWNVPVGYTLKKCLVSHERMLQLIEYTTDNDPRPGNGTKTIMLIF